MKEGTKKTFEGGIIGGDYARAKNPAFLAERAAKWAVLWARQEADFAARPREAIAITMPDGKVKEGTSWETTPMDIAKGISSQMAKKQIVAEVIYTGVRHGSTAGGAAALDEAFESDEVEGKGEMWDLTRPLEGDCKLFLRDFNDRDSGEEDEHPGDVRGLRGEACGCQQRTSVGGDGGDGAQGRGKQEQP